ncbi:hypothetical protein LTR17_026286 [Elasticomyces elasticus]|nr:hypothetical protein LTR17_026286 [Elasticomyces elasticus]
MWLFVDLIAAESLVVLISSLIPIFVFALAGTAFANGLWMCTGGFRVPPHTLNPFWRYMFHYIDYHSYVFQDMMVNEVGQRTFSCAKSDTALNGCTCLYDTELADQYLMAGTGVLNNYGYSTGSTGKWVGIMISIIFGYRLLGSLVLYLRQTWKHLLLALISTCCYHALAQSLAGRGARLDEHEARRRWAPECNCNNIYDA